MSDFAFEPNSHCVAPDAREILLADPGFGYTRDARFDATGFANMLALRAEVEGGRDDARAKIEKAVDLSYYERAMAGR